MTEQKKKILYVITKSNLGGAQRYVYDLATGLPKDRYDTAVVLGGNGTLKTMLEETGIRIVSFPSWQRDVRFFDEVKTFFALIKLFRKERPDVVHLNSSKIGGLGSLAARVARVPRIVFTAHGWPFNEKRGGFALSVIRFLSWLTVLFSHKTIVVCESDKHQGERMLFVKKKIVLIHNGINAFPLKEKDAARNTLWPGSTKKDAFWIGTIGELHPNKGYGYAFHALALFAKERPDVDFAYVIIGEGEQREMLGKLAHKLGLSDHIHFAGNPESARQYLSAFDTFLLPSVKEGLPYVLLEAGLAHLPVISTAVGGVPDIVNGGAGMTAPPANPEELAKSMISLSKDPASAQELAEKLAQRTTQGFSFTKELSATQHVYEHQS